MKATLENLPKFTQNRQNDKKNKNI